MLLAFISYQLLYLLLSSYYKGQSKADYFESFNLSSESVFSLFTH